MLAKNSHFYSKRMENGFFMAFSDGISIRFFKNVLVLGYKWESFMCIEGWCWSV